MELVVYCSVAAVPPEIRGGESGMEYFTRVTRQYIK